MRSTKAIFQKQARDSFKNRMIFIQFIIFPVMAFILTQLVAKSDATMPQSIFVTMFGAMFAGFTPLTMTASAIAEDKEHKSLRFLVMAGVKPYEYLMGIGGFVLLACSVVSVLFALIGGFTGMDFVKFAVVLILGSIVSIILGATFGIIAKNQQSAVATAMPIAMIFAFCPMIAQFDDNIKKVASILYTQQVNNIVTNDIGVNSTSNILNPVLIILANAAVFLVLFILAYKKRGLKSD